MAHEALRELDADERAAVFGGNAARVYLDARRPLERNGGARCRLGGSKRRERGGRSIPADEDDRRGHHGDEEHERPGRNGEAEEVPARFRALAAALEDLGEHVGEGMVSIM
jgi:hypothetical protein